MRALTQKDARNEKKKLLPAICFSGKFEKRSDTACIEHSGVICLDFDGFDSDKELEDFKFDLMLDKFTLSVFLSPSGDGLKVLIKIPNDIENHKFYFKGLEKYYNRKEFDTTSQNLSRVCYESYDPDLYFNTSSELFTDMVRPTVAHPRAVQTTTIRLNDYNEIARRLLTWWGKSYGKNKCNSYDR